MKALTGSDQLTARRMREDFWTFRPSHKLLLLTNHKPSVNGQDHALRRIRLVPFEVQFVDPDAPENKDKDVSKQPQIDRSLPEALNAERRHLRLGLPKVAWNGKPTACRRPRRSRPPPPNTGPPRTLSAPSSPNALNSPQTTITASAPATSTAPMAAGRTLPASESCQKRRSETC